VSLGAFPPLNLLTMRVAPAIRHDGLFRPDQDSSLPSYPLVESAVVSHRDAGF
jgi:hypothetical protein